MKTLLSLLMILFSFPSFAKDDISTFHRLLILNDKNQLLMAKIVGKDFWVTPGWYQDSSQTIPEGLNQLALNFGLKTSTPKLKGVFTLRNQENKIFSIRNFYIVKAESGKLKATDMIEEVQWLSIDKAMDKLTFPHIRILSQQIFKHPNQVWGGSIKRFKSGEEFKATLESDFYPLF